MNLKYVYWLPMIGSNMTNVACRRPAGPGAVMQAEHSNVTPWKSGTKMEQLTEAEAEASPPIAKDAPGLLELVAAKVTGWSQRWFPDAYIFATIAVAVVAIGALAI